MSISVIVPAYNEERYLGETLKSIQRAKEFLLKKDAVLAEIIVVENGSTDSTSHIALSSGARVVKETKHNVARVRNAGASFAKGKSSCSLMLIQSCLTSFCGASTKLWQTHLVLVGQWIPITERLKLW